MRRSRSRFRRALPGGWLVALVVAAASAGAQTRAPAPAGGADSSAFYRALDHEGAGRFREAAALFRQSLRGSQSVSALLGLERAYAELQWSDSLLEPLQALIREFPAEAVYRSVQLRTLHALQRDADVAAAFEQWTADSPRDPAPYRDYARLLLQRGRPAQAEALLARARAALGRGAELHLEEAQAHAAQGAWEESARAWRAALAGGPWLEQAATYALAPAPHAVRDAVRAHFFSPPVIVAARRALASLEVAWGSPANGWLALRDLPPDSAAASAWLDFAQRAEADERWAHAREALDAVLRYRHTPEVALRASLAALNSGDPGGALALAPLTGGGADSARVARTILPVHVRALAALGRPASAERLVETYERWLTPTSRAALARSIAFGWVRVGDMGRARVALTVAGPDADSSDAAGWLALYAGDIATARKLLRAGADASPEQTLALALVARLRVDSAPQLGMAFLTLARGDTLAAAAALAETAERLPDIASLVLYTAAQLHAARRDYGRAVPLWRRVVEQYALSAEAPAAGLEWARALRRDGDAAAAASRLEHLILTYPQSALVPQARRELELLRNTIPGTP